MANYKLMVAARSAKLCYDEETAFDTLFPTWAVLPLGKEFVVVKDGKRIYKNSDADAACTFLKGVIERAFRTSSLY